MASSLLEQLLGNAATNSSLLATVEARLEYIGLYLIAKAEGGREPKLAGKAPASGEAWPTIADADVVEIEAALSAATSNGVAALAAQGIDAAAIGSGDVTIENQLLCLVGQQLCPRAAPIPADSYERLYTLCDAPPRVVIIDEFLNFPGPGYHFSMSRVAQAKAQAWALIKLLQQQGKVDRIVMTCGNPATGKSTWIKTHGAAEPELASAVFFDDLQNNRRRRQGFWDGYKAAGLDLPVEAYTFERDFAAACASNRRRGQAGGHEVPQEVMERYRDEYEPPTLDEGYVRVRTLENQHDDETGAGGFALKAELVAAADPSTVGVPNDEHEAW